MDGKVDQSDASLLLQYVQTPAEVQKKADAGELTFSKEAGAVSGRGTALIDSVDVALILQKALDSTFKLPTEADEVDPNKPTVYIVGDSTACHYDEETDVNYWYRRVGFGDKVADYLTDDVNVVNLALSGRSSKSFATGINENGIEDAAAIANYAQLKSDIKAGDYLIIAWGHNDEKTDEYRYTDANKSIDEEGSFKKSLYDNYIKVAQDAGATPILCTPIIRANKTTLSDNDTHKSTGATGFPGGDYGKCIRDLGAELGVTVIDQLANTQSLFTDLTPADGNAAPTIEVDYDTKSAKSYTEPVGYYTLHAALQDGGTDTTHLNAYGASYVAYMLARDVKASDNTLAQYVKDGITAPTYSHSDCYNSTWVPFDESVYVPSSIWKVSSPWAGSVFGTGVGSFTEDNHPNHDIVEQGANAVRLTAKNNKGKIASSSDGIVMYFQEIDANQDFTLTATAHFNSYDAAAGQTAFGLMLRDNMFTDYQYDTKAAYYAVGNTSQSSGTAMVSYFRRLSTTGKYIGDYIQAAAASSDAFTSEKDVELKLSRTNGIVTVQIGDDEPKTYEGDDVLDLTKISKDKDYVGVFVARAADVTFKNINLQLS
jgi:lysophospholipase L1-like esterase